MASLKQAGRALCREVLRILIRIAWRPKVIYESDAAKQALERGGCVIISNHVRGFDGAAIQTALGHYPVWGLVAKDFVDSNAFLRFFLPAIRGIPVNRQEASLSWLRESRRVLKNGEDVYICPEGKCQFDKVLHPLHEGFVLLAATADAPVVPVFHNGNYPVIFGRRFRVIVGEPVTMTKPPEGITREEMRREADAMFDTLHGLEYRLNGCIRTGDDHA